MAGLVDSSVRIPILFASLATRFGLTSMPSSANTELSDVVVADQSEAAPR